MPASPNRQAIVGLKPAKNHHRSADDLENGAGLEVPHARRLAGTGGVEHHLPAIAPPTGNGPVDVVVVRVEEHEEGVAVHRLTPRSAVRDEVAVQKHREAAASSAPPVGLPHLLPVLAEPGDVLATRPAPDLAGEEAPPAQNRLLAAERDQPAHEREESLVDLVPMNPRQ